MAIFNSYVSLPEDNQANWSYVHQLQYGMNGLQLHSESLRQKGRFWCFWGWECPRFTGQN